MEEYPNYVIPPVSIYNVKLTLPRCLSFLLIYQVTGWCLWRISFQELWVPGIAYMFSLQTQLPILEIYLEPRHTKFFSSPGGTQTYCKRMYQWYRAHSISWYGYWCRKSFPIAQKPYIPMKHNQWVNEEIMNLKKVSIIIWSVSSW